MPSGKRQAADAAATDATVVTSAAVQSAEADMPTIETLTDAADAAVTDAAVAEMPAVEAGDIELTALAVAQMELAQLEASLASLPQSNPAYGTLEALRDAAIGTVALAEAEAALVAEKDAQIAAVQALPNTPPAVVAAMVAAIESHYAPVPDAAPDAAAPIVPTNQTAGGKKPIGTVATERNLTVAAALATDATLAQRADAAIVAWRGSVDDANCTTIKAAGTRYAGEMALGSESAGVANRADYVVMATAIRMRLELPPYNMRQGGQTVPDTTWLAALGGYPYAAKSAGGKDSLPLCFTDRREIALYPDGRFRLALPNQAGMRYIHSDAAAYAQFNGSAASTAALVATVATPTVVATVKPAAVPTPPATAATASGQLEATARCQHCTAKNFVSDAACRKCAATDWRIA
jgi:ribosomal protein L40E